jgi:hypothetical protein
MPAPRLLLAALLTTSLSGPTPQERLLSAASGDAFYLVVDDASKRLSLRLREVVLLEREASEVELATRRLAFRRAPAEGALLDHPWLEGRLWPPRPDPRAEIVPGQPAGGEQGAEPQPCFDVEFEGGLTLEVRSEEGCPLGTGLALRWASLKALWGWTDGEARARLRLVVPDRVARELHAVIPDGVRLVVLT